MRVSSVFSNPPTLSIYEYTSRIRVSSNGGIREDIALVYLLDLTILYYPLFY
nr:MAG TPA: hypothetical protein [Caudoviricetes sp.]